MPPPLPRERRALAITVRELRARRGLTQEQLAAAAGLGHNYVSDIESGRKRIAFETLLLLTRGLEVPLAEAVQMFEERLADEDGGAGSPRRPTSPKNGVM